MITGTKLGTLIQAHPESPVYRRLVEKLVGRPIPPDIVTAEAILAWGDGLTPGAGPVGQIHAPAPVSPPRPPLVTDGPTRMVRINIDRLVNGRDYWSRLDSYTYEIEVPESVVEEGNAAVAEWIWRHVNLAEQGETDLEHGEVEYGDSEDEGADYARDTLTIEEIMED